MQTILSRWEIDPPLIGAEEARGPLKPVFQSLLKLAVLRPTTPAGALVCTECGERRPVDYICDEVGGRHGLIHCQDCGVTRVPEDKLARWEIDTPALLAATFRGLDLSIQERVPGHLWQVGKARWAGHTREVWFARSFRSGTVAAVLQVLERRPKAILFAPTEAWADRWQEVMPNLTLALESTLSFAGEFELDVAYVEGRIVDAGLGAAAPAVRRPKKRADRAANIEALKNELIQHLMAARDHAFAAKERTGEAKLLQRPSQKALGKRVGLSESDVSRCLNDDSARELNLYWETAQNLDQIMAFTGPVSTGRKS